MMPSAIPSDSGSKNRSPDQTASTATSVVVGIDGCGAGQGALQYAIEEANRLAASWPS